MKRRLWLSPVGPMRTFTRPCFAGSCGVPASRVPARRPGNFHLRPQMKVTKAKGPMQNPSMRSARCGTAPSGPSEAPLRITVPARWAGLASRRPGVQRFVLRGRAPAPPAPTSALRGRCAAGVTNGPPGAAPQRAERNERCCIEGLCFGDFHLAPQMKVTRPPGRDPAGCQSINPRQGVATIKVRNGPQAATGTPATIHASRVGAARWSH